MSNLVESMKGCVDAILGIRECIGADLRRVFLITRTWTGRTAGEGTYTDVVTEIRPAPAVRELKHARPTKEGGTVHEGDLLIYHISKHQYEVEAPLNGKSLLKNVEKFVRVGEFFYNVIDVHERYITWDLMVRRRSDQRGSGG